MLACECDGSYQLVMYFYLKSVCEAMPQTGQMWLLHRCCFWLYLQGWLTSRLSDFLAGWFNDWEAGQIIGPLDNREADWVVSGDFESALRVEAQSN